MTQILLIYADFLFYSRFLALIVVEILFFFSLKKEKIATDSRISF